jgi:hypothetical protein
MFVRPSNRSVIFLKEKDAILTNDVWHITVYFSVDPYEVAISTIKEDLLTVEEQKKAFTSISG